MHVKPYINYLGEINWGDLPEDLAAEMRRTGLASFDWYLKAYVTYPATRAMVGAAKDFAQKQGVHIQDNPKFNLSVEQPEQLVEHFHLQRIILSQSSEHPYPLAHEAVGKLSAYLKAAVVYAVRTRCCIIADPNEVDQKIIALAATQQVRGFPCVVICRDEERQQWIDLAREYLPADVRIVEHSCVNAQTPKRSLWLMDYHDLEQGMGLPNEAPRFNAIIIDQAHYVKNISARRTKIAAALARRTNYRFLVTDFPENISPRDLKELIKILGKEAEFEHLGKFLDTLTNDPQDSRYPAHANRQYQERLAALYRKLRATCLVRRAADPGLRAQIHIQPIGLSGMPEWIDAADVLSLLRALGLQKVARAIDWLKDYRRQQTGKMIIFAHHQDVVTELSQALGIPKIFGNVTSERQRDEIIADFVRAEGAAALVLSSDIELTWDLSQVQAIVFAELLITPRQLYGIVDQILGEDPTRILPVHLLYADQYLDLSALKRLELRLEDYGLVMDGEKTPAHNR